LTLVELELAQQPLCPRPIPRGIKPRLKRERLANSEDGIEMRLLRHESHARQHAGCVAPNLVA
jgi:hypothetical protein